MTLIEMDAWSQVDAELTSEQAAELAGLDLVDVLVRPGGGGWRLAGNSRIGVAIGHGWELRVRPRLAVPNVFFLLAYASDQRGWRDDYAEFAAEHDLLDAVASGFSRHALTALERGLLRGYVHVDERLPTIRGRVRFADQIAGRAGLPLPVEVSYDDYTDDVLENRMLKSAVLALLRLPRVPSLARKRLLRLRGMLDDVGPVHRPREATMPEITRLNERYRSALRLAALVLRASSIHPSKGPLAATAYVFDMNRVFEDFVTVALRDALRPFGGEVKAQWAGSLDDRGRLPIRPDLTWWAHARCRAVIDAKYKALAGTSMPNADAYQMLAYCTALGLQRGYLVYAQDGGKPRRSHAVRNSACAIEVRTLDVEAPPDEILAQVDRLAHEIASGLDAQAAA